MTIHNPRLSGTGITDAHGRRWVVVGERDTEPRRRRRRRVPRIRVRNFAAFLVRMLMLAAVVAGLWWIIENPETAPMLLGTIAGVVVVGYVGVIIVGGAVALLGALFGTTNE